MTKWITKRGHKIQIKNGLSKNNFKLKPNLTEMQKQSANTSITNCADNTFGIGSCFRTCTNTVDSNGFLMFYLTN